MVKDIHVSAPDGYPYFGWTEEKIKEYIINKPLQDGDYMVIYNGQWYRYQYVLAKVECADSGKQHRVILSKPAEYGGVSFHRNGKNCFHPKSQSHMLPPLLPPIIMNHLTLENNVFLETSKVLKMPGTIDE